LSMAKYFDEIPDWLIAWLEKQKLFYVTTAPLSKDGILNISPKGMVGSFRIVNSKQVWYEDLTGSGIETIANVRENGRITICFNAFEGPPRICRLYGKGTVYEFGTPEYEALLPLDKRQTGSRSVIMIDLVKVSTSCGYSIPFFDYKAERNRLTLDSYRLEIADIEAEKDLDMCACSEPPRPEKGMKRYWLFRNGQSLNGLPGVQTGYKSLTTFHTPKPLGPLNSGPHGKVKENELLIRVGSFEAGELKLAAAAFLTGVILTASYLNFVRPRA